MLGKPLNRHDEKRLRALAEAGNSIQTLAQIFNQTSDAIRMKLKRLGVVVQSKKIKRTTTRGDFPIGENLLTHEEALKELVGAIESLRNSGQDKLELQRLRILVDALQAYDSVLDRISIKKRATSENDLTTQMTMTGRRLMS
jgi:phosphoenolpyruvate carboxylase